MPLRHRQRQQQPFGGDEAVAGLLGDLLGLVEQRAPSRATDRPGRRRAFDLGQLGERRLDRGQRTRCGIAAGGADQIGRQSPSSSSSRTLSRCSGVNC